MLLVDRLFIGGLRFVLDKLAQSVEQELNDEDRLREELLALQMRFEVGEVGKAEFEAIEKVLLARLRQLREAREGTEGLAAGSARVVGVEASFGGDEDEE
jgi:hypothetical protein